MYAMVGATNTNIHLNKSSLQCSILQTIETTTIMKKKVVWKRILRGSIFRNFLTPSLRRLDPSDLLAVVSTFLKSWPPPPFSIHLKMHHSMPYFQKNLRDYPWHLSVPLRRSRADNLVSQRRNLFLEVWRKCHFIFRREAIHTDNFVLSYARLYNIHYNC